MKNKGTLKKKSKYQFNQKQRHLGICERAKWEVIWKMLWVDTIYTSARIAKMNRQKNKIGKTSDNAEQTQLICTSSGV